jgi:hypothetical protein
MAKNIGILVTVEGEPVVKLQRNADGIITHGLEIGDVTKQHQALLLNMYPGELKESPLKGAGIADILLDGDELLWETKIKEQLQAEGMMVEKILFNTQTLEINAHYSS